MSAADGTGERSCPPAPAAAREVFGARLGLAERYAAQLAHEGIVRGLIGPRELPRVWERHVLNCAVLTDLVPVGARVVDVGSGAGLPGLPMAIRRPDLSIDLVEPALRRTDFLTGVIADLGLTAAVRVVRGRADEAAVTAAVGGTEWAVARAVAPLDRLVRWCLPLLAPGGRLLALKGAKAEAELAEHGRLIDRLGASPVGVERVGEHVLGEPTWVVVIERNRTSNRRERSRA